MTPPSLSPGAIPPVDEWQLERPVEPPFGDDASVSRFCASTLSGSPVHLDEACKASFGLFRWPVLYERHYYLKQARRAYRLPAQVGKYLILRRERRRVPHVRPLDAYSYHACGVQTSGARCTALSPCDTGPSPGNPTRIADLSKHHEVNCDDDRRPSKAINHAKPYCDL